VDYKSLSRSGPVSATSIYSDWEVIEGIRFPGGITVLHDGEELLKISRTGVEINPEIETEKFEKPGDL